MNRRFSILWSRTRNAWVVADEHACRRRRSSGGRRRRGAAALLAGALAIPVLAAELPGGGQVVLGQGRIGAPAEGALTIDQHSHRLAIDWQRFDIGAGNSVRFNQPGADAIALNRVLGSDGSRILGRLEANGRVFLINPNGVLFGQGAQVDVGGLVASTLDISNEDFAADRFRFRGDGNPAAVANFGRLRARDGGAVALLGGTVSNHGLIQARLGSVALAAGNGITLDFAGDGLLQVQIDEGAKQALVENHQLIQADGGQVLMTASAGDALLRTVVNNTGVIEARTLENHGGKILLLGDFAGGAVDVAGRLDASAPDGGDGGFIDTSGAVVRIADGLEVTTAAAAGAFGDWLIDPTDFTISAGAAPQSASGIGAATLAANLGGSNITLATVAAGDEPGDIHVDAPVSWSANTVLTLTAHRDIHINADITVNGLTGGLRLNHGGGRDYHLNQGARVNLAGFDSTFALNGTNYTVIRYLGTAGSTAVSNLQGIAANRTGNYVLGIDLDMAATAGWNGGSGWQMIGNSSAGFSGRFHGLGHTLSNLHVNRATTSYAGLFGQIDASGVVRDVTLAGGSVRGSAYVGALAGMNYGTIHHVASDLTVTSNSYNVGGLVGENAGNIAHASAAGDVTSSGNRIGGLVGQHYAGSLTHVSATGNVSGNSSVGGLVGSNGRNVAGVADGGLIQFAHATGGVTAGSYAGGLVGSVRGVGRVLDAYATGDVTGADALGGLVGSITDWSRIARSHAHGDVTGSGNRVGGLVGEAYTAATITQSYATGNATGAQNVGGLAGIISTSARASEVYATGDVTGTQYVGGIAGYLTTGLNGATGEIGSLYHAYATGAVTADDYGGGLIGSLSGTVVHQGYASGRVTVAGANAGGLFGYGGYQTTGLYWDSHATGQSRAFGDPAAEGSATFAEISGAAAQEGAGHFAFRQSAYALFDFADDWFMIDGNTRPFLAFEHSTEIATARQLQLVARDLDASYTLVGDIDLAGFGTDAMWYAGAGEGFMPIGTAANPFTGSLDGAGHRIANLNIDRAGLSDVGLFGVIGEGGAVRNVGIIGGLVRGADRVGIVAGTNRGAIATSYTDSAAVGADLVGGIAGHNAGRIEQSYATGSVQGAGEAGGIAGRNDGDGEIENVYATASVAGATAGGIVGHNAGGVRAVYATGAIAGAAAGGVAGSSSGTVEQAFWNRDSTGISAGGHGTGLGAAELRSAATFSGWDLADAGGSDAVWRIYEGNSFPLLRAFMASVTISSDSHRRTYDGTAAAVAPSYAFGGYLASIWHRGVGFDDTQVMGALTHWLTAAAIDAGSYGFNPHELYSSQQFYDIDYRPGTLTIDPATLTVASSGTVATSRVYDGTAAAQVTHHGALSGVFGDDEVGIALVDTLYGDRHVGDGKGVTGRYVLNGAAAGNYVLANDAFNSTADITAATLTAAGGGVQASRVYDGTTIAAVTDHGSLGGVIGDDAVTLSLTDTHYDDRHAGAGKAVTGRYLLDGADAGNYVLADETFSATADITAATLTAAGGGVQASRVYDGATTAAVTDHGSLGGVIGDDAVTLSLTDTHYDDRHAGAGKAVSGRYALAGADAGNYVLADETFAGTADITAATLIAAGGGVQASRVYDGTTAAAVTGHGGLTGLIGDDAVTLSLTDTHYGDRHAGTGKTVTGRYALAGADAGNYVLADETFAATADITAATLTAAGGAVLASRVYDGTTAAAVTGHGGLTGLIGDDAVTLSLTDTHYGDRHAGTGKTVTGRYILAGADIGNYLLADDTFTATADITARPIAVVADDQRRFAGQADPQLTWRIDGDGLVDGDSLGAVFSGEPVREPGEVPGVYAIRQGSLAGNGNYRVTFGEGEFEIAAAGNDRLGWLEPVYAAALSSHPTSAGTATAPRQDAAIPVADDSANADTAQARGDGPVITLAAGAGGQASGYRIVDGGQRLPEGL